MKGKVTLLLLAALLLSFASCRNKHKKPDNVRVPGISEITVDGQEGDKTTNELYDSKVDAFEDVRDKTMELPAMLRKGEELLLRREGYFTSYNQKKKIPNWVAWHLTEGHTSGRYYRDGQVFMEDSQVPRPRATDNDYYTSRYDRGHMCPSGDNKWSAKAQEQSFLFTNVCPQNHDLNKGDWNDLEMQCRYWAKKYGGLYIVTGPVFYDKDYETIGKNKVAVPDAFFKVLLSKGMKTKAIGFVCPNRGGHKDMTDYVRSVDEIELLTGLDFFPLLDDKVENRVEAADRKTMISQWQVEKAVSYYNSRTK